MKKSILYIVLAVSVIVNIVLLCVFMPKSCSGKEGKGPNFSNKEIRQKAAETIAKKLVCENLYYPDSYDPVNTTVDSAFCGYMTDADCINAAVELIDLLPAYESAKSIYEDEHIYNKDRIKSLNKTKELQPKIEKQMQIIRNRSTTRDGEFIGWQVIHRYRAKNQIGVVNFGNELFVLDSSMSQCYYRFSLNEDDDNNLKNIRFIIEEVLNLSSND